jgi:hypothetical protein
MTYWLGGGGREPPEPRHASIECSIYRSFSSRRSFDNGADKLKILIAAREMRGQDRLKLFVRQERQVLAARARLRR